ncbi:MAG: type II CRISPR-associated endonuclease Cas1 [Bacilli bacterium]|nr:type II CRISPR-associated endonuclease Cas1 [Bacilli bacterium]MDD4065364.1 type II CRISPR-associated endonuclease Cas1 [Bacilli bacterium]
MGWRIIYIEESDNISLHLDNIKVKSGVSELLIPLIDINALIIDNYKTTVTLNLLNKCLEYNVNVIICDHQHHPQGLVLPISGHYLSPIIFQKQMQWKDEQKSLLWRRIVKNKIFGQTLVLYELGKDQEVIDKMLAFSNEIVGNDDGNREGLCAKMYFRELFGKDFYRDKECVINAGLDYGYSIFRSLISKVIVSKGLHPNLGIFHKGTSNYFNLSDDIIEVFRPIVDLYVYNNLLDQQIFKKDHRLELIRLTTYKILYKNKKQTIFNVIEDYVDSIIAFFDKGDVSRITCITPVLYDL